MKAIKNHKSSNQGQVKQNIVLIALKVLSPIPFKVFFDLLKAII
ncbi:hypothetical protein [Staphylococcus delphini]|nr:hypothetical protein [Staphylococcus delphini]